MARPPSPDPSAPRRPERFDEVAATIERSGFSMIRRSSPTDSRLPTPSSVYLLDSIGELASLYGEASLAFVGGSLRPTGGHNPIEAWAQGVPVVVGPHMENFRDIAAAGVIRHNAPFGRLEITVAPLVEQRMPRVAVPGFAVTLWAEY